MNIVPKGAAERAGLQGTTRDRSGRLRLGDIITGINEDEINSRGELLLALEKYKPGDQVKVVFQRDQEDYEADLVLGGANR